MVSRIAKLPKNKSIFLFGPRQTGKSTLIKSMFSGNEKTVLAFDLLRSDTYMRFLADPSLFRKEIDQRAKSVTHVFVDEVQRIPGLLDEVHSIMESPSPPLFILTGSSARKLKRSNANLLAGRATTRKLFPLTHLELDDRFDLTRALMRGTLPRIYLDDERDSANQDLRSYVETYLKEEIEAEALVRSSGTFLRFLFQAGHENGNIVNYSSIARDCGSTTVTVKEYFQILEDTLVGSFLFPFSKSRRQRLARHPKFYFFDTGVQRALTKKLTMPLEPRTSELGRAFESWVIRESIILSDYFEKDYDFTFFRTEKGAEVDLVIETPRGQLIAVEIKSSPNPAPVDFASGLHSFSSVARTAKKICVCTSPRPYREGEVEMVPWKVFFERLREGF